MRLLLCLLLAARCLGYTTPTGIPQPMWGAVDPINAAKPAQPGAWPSAEAAGYYYIDNTHGSATDTSNTYGYPNRPRLTIPETTYAAGSYCEIHGGPYTRTGGDAEQDIVCTGTEANPCWFVGTSNSVRPELRGNLEVSGTYIIMQWLKSSYDTANSKANGLHVGGDPDLASYVCIRNCTSQGDGTFHSGFSAGVAMNGLTGAETNNVVFYACDMLDNNSYTYALTTEDDNHGMLIGLYTNNVWVLDCDIHNNSGDAIQVSGNNATGGSRSQYVYIGNCRFYHNSENAVDVKSSLDVVMSRNEFYDYVPAGGSDGTAVVIQQEGGDGCDNVWVIFNTIYDCTRGVRSEEVVTNVYVLGNVMHDFTDTYSAFYMRTSSASYALIDNTIARYTTVGWRWDNTVADMKLHGNIFTGRIDSGGYEIRYDTTPALSSINYNLFDTAVSFRSLNGATTYTSLAAHQAGTGYDANSVAGNAALASAVGDNYNLTASSAAIGASTEHAAYAYFLGRYGLSIAMDYNGNSRPQGGSWDIGAVEYVAANGRTSTLRKGGSAQ